MKSAYVGRNDGGKSAIKGACFVRISSNDIIRDLVFNIRIVRYIVYNIIIIIVIIIIIMSEVYDIIEDYA